MSEQNLMESTDHGTTSVVPPVKRNRGRGGKPQFGLTGASMLVVMTIAALYSCPAVVVSRLGHKKQRWAVLRQSILVP